MNSWSEGLGRLGKISFLLLCMMGMVMAPLSGMASMHGGQLNPVMQHSTNGHMHKAQKSSQTDIGTPCKTPECCHGADNAPMAPGGCNDCDAACQNTCGSTSAVLGLSGAKLPHAAFDICNTAHDASRHIFKPEAASPPPRA